MADKLIIVLANSDPARGAEVIPPLYQATVAAAMEYEVEVILTGQSSRLALQGVAEQLMARPDDSRSVYYFIREAYDTGVKFKVCTTLLDETETHFIEEIGETVGAAYLISEAMDSETVTFTY